MAFYNNYPNYNFGYTQPNNNQYSQINNGIIWVQGEAGAKSYLVAPNSTVQLWDSEANVIYLKSADASGMPSIKILDYTIRGNQELNENNVEKDEIAELKNEIAELKNEIAELKIQIKPKKGAKKDDE